MRHELEIAVVQQRYEDKVTSGILEVYPKLHDAARISTRSRNCGVEVLRVVRGHTTVQSTAGVRRGAARPGSRADARMRRRGKIARPEFYLHVEMVAKRSQRDFRNVAREKI